MVVNRDRWRAVAENQCGVTLWEACEGALVPVALVAVTVKVQGLRAESPFTIIGLVRPEAFCPELAVTV